MKRVTLFLLPLLMLLPSAGFSQENPKVEVFGGYSFFRASQYDYLVTNLHGFDASVAGNLNSWLGVEGDFGGHFGSPSVGPFRVPYLDVNVFTFMGGPRLTYRGSSAVTPFAHALIGTTRASAGAFGIGYGKSALSTALGGGIDIRLSEHVAVRAIQADYLMTRFFDERQNNVRVSSGIVFRF
jgi:hypothetical protein